MSKEYSMEELNQCSKEELVTVILGMQGQLSSLNENLEKLMEQIRIANSYRFGRKTETLHAIDGQMSFFDDAEAAYVQNAPEPTAEDVLPKQKKARKKKGQRELDLAAFPEEIIPAYRISEEELNAFYGEGNWRRMEDEVYKRLRHEPESWTVEVHTVEVYVGTDGDHQDEFLRGKRPKDLLRNSIVTPSLLASILNVKYVNSATLDRIEQEFRRNGVNISRQTQSNWIVNCSERYFTAFVKRLQTELLKQPVTHCDETPTQVLKDAERPNSKSYMWVHRTGEYDLKHPVVIYEYQKGRDHHIPLEFYKDYKGVLVTDGLQQYHLVEQKLPEVTNANCWAHTRRSFADAVKAAEKQNPEAVKQSIAYQALQKIAAIYHADNQLKELTADQRLQGRKENVEPLVEDFFAWVKSILQDFRVLPKGETAKGLNYCLNQEKYLRVFLTNGNVPLDNSAAERAIRTFCVGKKNWLFHNTANGAKASAAVYSISETAKLNGLRPYYYFKHLLTELPNRVDEKGNIDPSSLTDLLPWSEDLPEECRKPRR
ncbi:MAG: IS66 family transposase [Lachnospiraceae bacterium]|nr:IS66 family transposase [Lachnospiraceae bacterium]